MQEASYLLELYRLVEGRVASQCCYYSIHLGMTVPMSLRQTRTCPSELSGPDFVDFKIRRRAAVSRRRRSPFRFHDDFRSVPR
jgi:hypothetical protein